MMKWGGLRRSLTWCVVALLLVVTVMLVGRGYKLRALYEDAKSDCAGQPRVLPGGRVIDQLSSETRRWYWHLRYRTRYQTTVPLDHAADLAEEARQVWAGAQLTDEGAAARIVDLEATDCAIHISWAVWPPEVRIVSAGFHTDRIENGAWTPITPPVATITIYPRLDRGSR